jgi:hypothetical protein
MHFTPFSIFGGTGINVPIGAILPIVNTQAWVPPANGAVKDGFALCNGQTFSSLGAGKYDAAFSGNLPSLHDERFVMGSTVTGVAAGANGLVLVEQNIPRVRSNNQSPTDHNHGVSTTTTGAESAPHSHGWGSGVENSNHIHYFSGGQNSSGGGYSYQPLNHSSNDVVTGYITANHRHSGNSGYSGIHFHNVSFTTANASHSHTHVFGGSSQSIDIRPQWISAIYVMRVL